MRRGGRNKSVLEWILLKKRKLQQGRNEGKSQKNMKNKKKKKLGKMKTNMEDMLVHIVPVWGNIVANVC